MTADFITVGEIIKAISLYLVPIAAFVISIISLIKSQKVSALERKIKEYEAVIKKAEVEKIEAEKNKVPAAMIDARVTKISDGKYKLFAYNKGDAPAYNVDYEIDKNASVKSYKRITPFEVLEPGDHFEEPVIVVMGGSGPKFSITTSWEDSDGEKHQKHMVKSLE